MSLLRTHAVKAIWKRQLWSLLGNPLGYVFVLAFVLIYGGLLFLPAEFFVRNIDDLGPVHDVMPWLLSVLIPAIAMGSWASERELGTEEQVLTLPLSETDALVGKWLAVSTYFTVALLCSLSNVAVLMWLGQPDMGLVVSQYLGWWLFGLVFSAVGVMVSTWVSLPAVAFVFGVVVCGGLCALESTMDWLSAFERGVVSVGQVGMGLALAAFFLGCAILSLSARRWQAAYRHVVVGSLVTFVGVIVTLFNVSVQVDRAAIDVDVTEEGLSSLSAMSSDLLDAQKRLVKITAFVSETLPPELSLKGQEVLNFLQLVERSAPRTVQLTVYRPSDSLDEAAAIASKHFGLKPKTVVVDTVTGKEEREVFLAAVVTSGTRTEKISHFSPGLSVEYELVRAVRSAATVKKTVVGIARTALNMLGGLNYETRRMDKAWQVVDELKKQYDVRTVNLDVPVADDVAVLIVPQPSSLKDKQVEMVHDYIWAGRPALLLEDPMPMFSGPNLGTSSPRPRKGPATMAQQQQAPEPKPDLTPLFTALGLDVSPTNILWSDFNPSHQFRKVWPRNLVWVFRSKEGLGDADYLSGINSLLFPWPGEIRRAKDAPAELNVKALAYPVGQSTWGHHQYDEFFIQSLFGKQMRPPERHVAIDGPRPNIAVEVTGKMKRAYGPDEPPAEAQDSSLIQPAKGTLSEKPIRVIFVADTDFAHNEFFAMYRNADDRFSDDAIRFLAQLRNVQFISNLVDSLSGEKGYLDLRTRRPKPRPLTALVKVLDEAQLAFRTAETKAQTSADEKISKLKADFEKRLSDIQNKTGLDENAKAQLRAQVQRAAQRQLDTDTVGVERERDLAIRAASIVRERQVEDVRGKVRTMALGLPSVVLAMIALFVWARRRREETLTIPSSRKRGS